MQIVIAGASGYIGRALVPQLLKKFPEAQITALSRSSQKSDDPRINWQASDLFSMKSLEEALPPRIDLAFYLVHSMGPTAQLDQGSFADYDLILADNFSKTLKNKQISHLIYLGGLIPQTEDLSLHLRSRLEVEEVFQQYGLPTTVFRAGLILGEAGSSFQILLKLVKRLPVMICPAWTQTQTTPVDLQTVISALVESSMNEVHAGKIYDLAGCKYLSYLQMMKETARKLGLKRHFLPFPFFTPTLSKLWVTLITNTSKDLVYPLVESLEHSMVARTSHQFSDGWQNIGYYELLDRTPMKTMYQGKLFGFRAQRKTVRSVQRMRLPPQNDAISVKNQYFLWLGTFAKPLIQVKPNSSGFSICTFFGLVSLLELSLIPERSTIDRQLLRITGGLLAAKGTRGRLEFRCVLNRKFILIAIHEYKPTLPWFIYIFSQALAHLLVMRLFERALKKGI